MYTVVNSTLDEAADLRSSVRAAMDSTDDKALKDNLRRWQLMYESGELSEERLRVCLRRTNALAQDLRELEIIRAASALEESESRKKEASNNALHHLEQLDSSKETSSLLGGSIRSENATVSSASKEHLAFDDLEVVHFERSRKFLDRLVKNNQKRVPFIVSFDKSEVRERWAHICYVLQLYSVGKKALDELLDRSSRSLQKSICHVAKVSDGHLSRMSRCEVVEQRNLNLEDKARVEITLRYKYSTINPPKIKRELIFEISQALKIPPEYIAVESITAGSVVVVISVTSALVLLAAAGICGYELSHMFTRLNVRTYMLLSGLFGLSVGFVTGAMCGMIGGPLVALIAGGGAGLMGSVAGTTGGYIHRKRLEVPPPAKDDQNIDCEQKDADSPDFSSPFSFFSRRRGSSTSSAENGSLPSEYDGLTSNASHNAGAQKSNSVASEADFPDTMSPSEIAALAASLENSHDGNASRAHATSDGVPYGLLDLRVSGYECYALISYDQSVPKECLPKQVIVKNPHEILGHLYSSEAESGPRWGNADSEDEKDADDLFDSLTRSYDAQKEQSFRL